MAALPHVYRRRHSASAFLAACLSNIGSREAPTRAWVRLDVDAAKRNAKALDDEAADGHYRGPLHGMPIGVKDLFDVAGMPTRAGSVSREHADAAGEDAPIIAALRAAGCLVLGKTKTTEYAWLDPTDATNPFSVTRTPGGSSSGSGAAVGAGMVGLALGTQTVGSVCRPAAYCGTAAFKPTTGSTSMQGVVAFAPSYDTAGFLAPSLEVAVDAWRAVVDAGIGRAGPQCEQPGSLAGLRFARPRDACFAQIDSAISGALERTDAMLSEEGASRCELTLGIDLSALRTLQRTVMFHEAARQHAGLLADTGMFARLGPHWRECLETGAGIGEAEARDARAMLARITADVHAKTEGLDFLLVPAASSVAPARKTTGDPGLILPWTVFGNPLAVLPIGLDDSGLPTAVMLAGQPTADSRFAACALATEHALKERAAGFQGPTLF